MTTLRLQRSVTTAVDPSPRVNEVASMFGLGNDRDRSLDIVPPTQLRLTAGRVVFVTGPSGSGKSTLLRLIAEAVRPNRLVDLDQLELPVGRPLVELWDEPLADTMRRLSRVGLADAFVMLRHPEQLSDGQRFRLRLAEAQRAAEHIGPPSDESPIQASPGDESPVLIADEFCATLDRSTASVIARQTAKWARAQGVALVVATTHDDLLEPLAPNTLVAQHLGGTLEVHER